MGALINLFYIAIASFVVLAQPAASLEINTTQVPTLLSPIVAKSCKEMTAKAALLRQIEREQVKIAVQRLLQRSAVPQIFSNQTQLPANYSCGGSTGWRRVAYLNMSDPSQQCPSVWREITTPHRVCGRRSATCSCEGVNYTTGSEKYARVCGRIIGYQVGNPDSFRSSCLSIDTPYVEEVSLTHGYPRKHIWTFANGVDEQTTYTCCTCPCVTGSTGSDKIPSFVGQNYFCETGLTRWPVRNGVLWPDGDPLWDGEGCGPTSSCCTFNSPPWFNVQLLLPTNDNIEVRICGEHGIRIEDTPIQLIEIYVK